MRRSWTVGAVMALFMIALPAAASAQVGSDATGGPKAEVTKRGERFRAAFLERLGEKLELDASTVEKLGQSFDQFRDEARTLHQERKALKTKLQEAVDRGATDQEVEAILAEAEAHGERSRQLRAAHQAEVKQILGTQGYAKFVLLKQKARHRAWKKMGEHRRHQRGSQAPEAFQPGQG